MEFFPLAGSLNMPSLALNLYNIIPKSMSCGKIFQTFNLIAYPVRVLCHSAKIGRMAIKEVVFVFVFLIDSSCRFQFRMRLGMSFTFLTWSLGTFQGQALYPMMEDSLNSSCGIILLGPINIEKIFKRPKL